MSIFTKNLIPKMTSNTSPEGVVSASSYHTSYYNAEPWKAFSRNNDSSVKGAFAWVSQENDMGWLSYKFSKKQKINKYTILPQNDTNVNGIGKTPLEWTFEAFNGHDWIILDKRTSVTDWVYGLKKEFEFNNTSYYQKYRINIVKINGDNYVGIGELEMMSKINSNKFVFQDNNSLKTFDLSTRKWKTISPSQNNFNNLGVSNLDNLIVNTSKQIKHSKITSNTFTEKVNFKSFKTISNIKVV